MINALRGKLNYTASEFPGIIETKKLENVEIKDSLKYDFFNELTVVPWGQIGTDRIIRFDLSKLINDPVYKYFENNLTAYLRYYADHIGFKFFIMDFGGNGEFTEVKVHQVPKVISVGDKSIIITKTNKGWFVRFDINHKPYLYKNYTEMLEDIIGKL